MFGMFGKIRTQPGLRDELLTHLLKSVDHLRELDGCYLYVINNDPHDPDAIWIVEVWRSQADHQASLTHAGVKAVIAAARPLIAEMSDRVEIVPLGGKGLPAPANRE